MTAAQLLHVGALEAVPQHPRLADQVGVRRQTILALEKGHYIPSTLLAFKIARALAMRVDELFALREEDDA